MNPLQQLLTKVGRRRRDHRWYQMHPDQPMPFELQMQNDLSSLDSDTRGEKIPPDAIEDLREENRQIRKAFKAMRKRSGVSQQEKEWLRSRSDGFRNKKSDIPHPGDQNFPRPKVPKSRNERERLIQLFTKHFSI